MDTTSSPKTVYLNRNVCKKNKTNENGENVEFWSCERAQLSLAEYEELKQTEGIFSMPEFLSMREQLNNQELIIAEIQVNSEYSICLQELSLS